MGLGRILKIAGVALSLGLFAGAANAVTLSFSQITSNGSTGGTDQLFVDITDNGAGGALFNFDVLAGVNANLNVTEIYLDDRTPLFQAPMQPSDITVQVGTNFTAGTANPGDLPGGNAVGFSVTSGLLADAQGASVNGLTIGDDLQFNLTFMAGFSFADLLAAIDSGAFRIGMHVRSHLNDRSESYVNVPPGVIPVPAALPLLLSAFGIGAFVTRKRRKAA